MSRTSGCLLLVAALLLVPRADVTSAEEAPASTREAGTGTGGSPCSPPPLARAEDAAHRPRPRQADVRRLRLQVPRQHHQRAVSGVREPGAWHVLLLRVDRSRTRVRDRPSTRSRLRVRLAHAAPVAGEVGKAGCGRRSRSVYRDSRGKRPCVRANSPERVGKNAQDFALEMARKLVPKANQRDNC